MHVKQCNRDGIRTRNLRIRSPTPYPLGHTIIQQADNTTATIATSNFFISLWNNCITHHTTTNVTF